MINNYVEKSAVLVTAIFLTNTYDTINIAEQIRAVTNIYIECNKYMQLRICTKKIIENESMFINKI